MSALAGISEQIKDRFQDISEKARQRVFGANNENLDFFIDSFNKFDTRRKVIAVCCVVAAVLVIFLGVFTVYFAGIRTLKVELSNSLASLRELQNNVSDFEAETSRFRTVTSTLSGATSQFSAKPFFDELSKKINVKIDSIDEKPEDFLASDPLAKKGFRKVNVEMYFKKISIPRLLEFIKEAEKSNRFLKVTDLKIREIYGGRLYFSVNLTIRGYAGRG